MIVVLALAVVLAGAAVAVVGVMLHRDLVRIAEELARSGYQPELNRWLGQFWADVKDLHQDYAKAADNRARDIETAVTHIRQNQAELTRFVNWMAPLVQHWSKSTPEGR